MSKRLLCRLCAGQRKVPGMGFMSAKCPECDGKGYVQNTHYICEMCDKEITLGAAKIVLDEKKEEEKKPRARKSLKNVVSTDDMSLNVCEDTASF